MTLKLEKYNTFIFDCDGVVLNSNFIKANCFYLSVKDFGEEIAFEFKNYHASAGGISRIKKYDYLINEIFPKFKIKVKNKDDLKNKFISKYEKLLKNYIFNSDLSPYLINFKKKYNSNNWIMISGSEQNELRKILIQKGINNLFNLGIFGSPLTKNYLLKKKIKDNEIKFPAIFFGDSKVDYFAAKNANVDFIFLYEWTDLENWNEFCNINKINFAKNLGDLL